MCHEEFHSHLADFGLPEQDIESLFFEIDQNKDGLIDLCEFESAYTRYVQCTSDSAFAVLPLQVKVNESYIVTDELLGEGGFATVYRGTVRKTGEAVAVKQMSDNQDCKLISLEVGLLRSCQHPGVIGFVDFLHDAPSYYMVTELVEGGELFDRIVSKEHYAEVDARKVIHRLLQVTEHLHSINIVHRDYKPENLLLKSMHDDSDMRLCDFGFATLAKGRSITQVVGTPGYMAPEVLHEKPYGVEVDLWATGILMFMLIEGAAPFYDEDPDKLDDLVKKAVLDFDPEMWCAVSPEAKDLVSLLLHRAPHMRITAQQALKHKWFTELEENLQFPLCGVTSDKIKSVKRNFARIRMKTAGRSIMMARSLSSLSNTSKFSSGPLSQGMSLSPCASP